MAGRKPVLGLAVWCFVLVGFSRAYIGETVFKRIIRYFRCSSSYSPDGLALDLRNSLFGQHLVSRVILQSVKGFMEDSNPSKPLVLSLHGSAGTGKNHVAKIIAQNLFKKGDLSSQVHLFIATHHFPHPAQVDTYKAQLQQWIRGNVSVCPRSMFIFDEMDKMNPVLIETIKCFLDHYTQVDGVSYRHAIFLFLSNQGGQIINQVALDFWLAGKQREEIELNSQGLESGMHKYLFNDKNGGFWRSSLLDSFVVDFFIPFLPLERKHVILCALAEMKALGHTANVAAAEKLPDDLTYFPPEKAIFSVKGCKSVRQRVKYYI